MPCQHGAFKTAPLESADGKFDLLGWENDQLKDKLGVPHPMLHFTHWQACLGPARSGQRNTQAFSHSP